MFGFWVEQLFVQLPTGILASCPIASRLEEVLVDDASGAGGGDAEDDINIDMETVVDALLTGEHVRDVEERGFPTGLEMLIIERKRERSRTFLAVELPMLFFWGQRFSFYTISSVLLLRRRLPLMSPRRWSKSR